MKTYKKEIKYNPEQDEYIIKLKKGCKWCWLLLLLLLPLILLIPLKKEVKFIVKNAYDNSEVENLAVNFDYTKRDFFNFDSLSFLTRSYPHPKAAYYTDTTDNKGVVVFKNIKYNVYQWMFKNEDTTRTYAISECSNLDTTINLFDLKGENIIYMHSILLDFEFTVVDADDDNDPLVGAMVRIEADKFNIQDSAKTDADKFNISDSAKTDADGKVKFAQIPYCSKLFVEGSRYGYRSDTINDIARFVYKIQDTLYLKQIKKPVKFFVKDLKSKKGIPAAIGKLYIDNKGTEQFIKEVRTNNRGAAKVVPGEGNFPDVHIATFIKIHASKAPYYKDSTTLNFYKPNYFEVNKWINKFTEEQRTIYLKPIAKPIVFTDVDELTKRGIAAATNTVTITGSDGKSTTLPPIIADSNGNFGFSAVVGDKITIKAESDNCPPEYLMNDYSIQDADFGDLKNDASRRIIPLKRKDAPKVKFRNIDKDTGIAIEGVKNMVSVSGGATFTVISGAGGWFTIDKVYQCELISITATKGDDYLKNDTKIQRKKYEPLMAASQSERDIPMKKIVRKEVTIKLSRCHTDERDIYDLYIDGNLVDVFDSGDNNKLIENTYSIYTRKLEPGSHTIELRLRTDLKGGTCKNHNSITIEPGLLPRTEFKRDWRGRTTTFSWNIVVRQ